MEEFKFTPENGFADVTAFPDPSTEADTREQLMRLHLQTQSFINLNIKTAIETIAAAQGDPDALQAIMDDLQDALDGNILLQNEVDALTEDVTELQGQITYQAYSMDESDWTGSVYSFEADYPSTDYDIEIALDGDSATSTEITAWGSAQILGSATTNTVTAFGTVPSVALPVILKVVAKI